MYMYMYMRHHSSSYPTRASAGRGMYMRHCSSSYPTRASAGRGMYMYMRHCCSTRVRVMDKESLERVMLIRCWSACAGIGDRVGKGKLMVLTVTCLS